MATSGGEHFMSDEIVTNKCCICAKKNKRTEAAKYCVDCKDYFCTSCVGIHAAIPSTEGHTMLDKSNFHSVRSGAGYLPSFPTQRCDKHKSEVLNMYCQDHDKVGCATCIAIDHRSCKKIFSIPENIDNLYRRSEIIQVEQTISSLGKEIEAIRKAKEAYVQKLSKSLQTAVDSVKTFKQDLQLLLNKIEEDTITELKKEFNRIEKSIAHEVKNALNHITELNKMTTQLKSTEGNKVHEFVCAKTFATLNKKYEEDLNQQQGQSDETVSFTADQSIKQFLKQMKSFGKVTCQTSSVPTRLTVKPQPSTSTVIHKKTALYKVTKQRKVNAKLQSDTNDCKIYGSCVTEDGSLLLADTRNQKLKRLNLSTRVLEFTSLIYQPRAVCQVSSTEAAVSLLNNTVQFVTLEDKMSVSRSLTFNHCCEGLGHYNGKLFISDSGNSVYIHDINGKELRKITTDASGKDIFTNTRHIAISSDGSRVFVADWDKGLITFDIQGNYLSTLSEREIQASGCHGVSTDGSDAFVCGRDSDNVVQIGQDQKLIGQTGAVKHPLSVCFDSQKKRLYVTKYSNNVRVLELE